MNNNLMEYKGFFSSVNFNLEDGVLHGKVEFINDLIIFEANTLPSLEKEFHDAVDDYIETCEQLNREPCKNFSGSFNVRIGPDLHKKCAIQAKKKGCSLNDVVKFAVDQAFSNENVIVEHIHRFEPTEEFTSSTKVPISEDSNLWQISSKIQH